ncbi:uncharacterized protein TNCT_568001 [Trichonephila clavata]|uniref:Uncharacterized protein n=1 Tax=Trichonephila clavata TaxID=2740835 RepID=A0A8X6LT08_TRICU|nr:uncharacterized protein TNCT_568001 [Trichonephila clavata]
MQIMERYGYLIVDSSGTCVYQIHNTLYKDIINCVKNAIEQKNDDGNSILYFRILNNSSIVKYLHNGKQDITYSYVYLHQSSLSKPYYIYQGANKLYKDLLQCIIDVKSIEMKVPDSPSYRLKIGYLKILDADELLIDLHAPL